MPDTIIRKVKFQHPDMSHGFTCPTCGTSTDAPVVLVAIPGTERDGIVEARQYHAECFELVCKMHGITVQFDE